MTIHYHGTPITPNRILQTLSGRCFCVSFANPAQVSLCHQIGQSVMLDNGAFSMWRKKKPVDWDEYYYWIEPWLEYPATWAVIPDIIEGCEEQNKLLVDSCPYPRHKMAPVWHLHESLDYLDYLVKGWPKVCFGSSAQYAIVGSLSWHTRIKEAFNIIQEKRPSIHMLRGMNCCKMNYPFQSVDSADVALNHHSFKLGDGHALQMVNRWDSMQCAHNVNCKINMRQK